MAPALTDQSRRDGKPPDGPSAPDDCGDFFTNPYGAIAFRRWRERPLALRLMDGLYDLRLRASGAAWRCASSAARIKRQAVLIAAVAGPARGEALNRLIAALRRGRHRVDAAIEPMGQAGKFENVNAALSGVSLDRYDWLLIVDDDVAVPDGFLDIFIGEASRRGFKLAQPAHRFRSYATFELTERQWGTVARRTGFVESGPITLLNRDTFADLLPFPSQRWGWGIDLYWADVARQRRWPI